MAAYPVGNLQVFLVRLQYEATKMALTVCDIRKTYDRAILEICLSDCKNLHTFWGADLHLGYRFFQK